MDSLYAVDQDGFRRCPYNPNHKVIGFRFIGHVLKCSKSSGKPFQVCPWNATHHVVAPHDFELHTQTCIHREHIDDFREALSKKEVLDPVSLNPNLVSAYNINNVSSSQVDISLHKAPEIRRFPNEENEDWNGSMSDATDEDADFCDYASSASSGISIMATGKPRARQPHTLASPKSYKEESDCMANEELSQLVNMFTTSSLAQSARGSAIFEKLVKALATELREVGE